MFGKYKKFEDKNRESKDKNKELENENDELKYENKHLKYEKEKFDYRYSQFKDENERFKNKNEKLEDENSQLDEQNSYLSQENLKLKKNISDRNLFTYFFKDELKYLEENFEYFESMVYLREKRTEMNFFYRMGKEANKSNSIKYYAKLISFNTITNETIESVISSDYSNLDVSKFWFDNKDNIKFAIGLFEEFEEDEANFYITKENGKVVEKKNIIPLENRIKILEQKLKLEDSKNGKQ